MAGSIVPLPVMIEEEQLKKQQERESAGSRTLVVRYGYMRQIAELPFSGSEQLGCGSKLVIRTDRGIEISTLLTTTCPNGGCGHALTRKQMLQYIDNSGGRDYPFTTQGRVLRVATVEDLNEQSRLDDRKMGILKQARTIATELNLRMKVVDVELLLGGDRIIFHYTSEDWVDFRELVRRLAGEYQTRIEMHQVNARDEARLVADYEKCGQHCCCKQFLKVLKPVSMKAAKTQKATLDPVKISGRCGRLMCCLRYEEETYDSLRKRLPHRNSKVETDDGVGTVIDSQILTQLVLVRFDKTGQTNAYPVENIRVLTRQEEAKLREELAAQAIVDEARAQERAKAREAREARESRRREPRRPRPGQPLQQEEIESREQAEDREASAPAAAQPQRTDAPVEDAEGSQLDSDAAEDTAAADRTQPGGEGEQAAGEGGAKRKRRRRRRRRGGGGGAPGGAADSGGDASEG